MSNQFLDFDLADFSNTNIKQLSLAEIRRDSYTEGFIKGKEEGRADAIEEFTSALHDLIVSCGNYVSTAEIRLLAEQLKEQTK